MEDVFGVIGNWTPCRSIVAALFYCLGDRGSRHGSAGRGGDIDKHKLPGIISASVLGAILGRCFDVWGIGVLGIGYQ